MVILGLAGTVGVQKRNEAPTSPGLVWWGANELDNRGWIDGDNDEEGLD